VAQRTVFKKETIIDAAFTLTRGSGWGSVTARNIARKLDSSTMPLYSRLRSMEEIEKEVRARAGLLMQEYQRRGYTEDAMTNAAVGYVAFARHEKNLFRFLYVDRPVTARGRGRRRKRGDAYARKGIVDLEEQAAVARKDPLVLKNWAFIHGLASLISAGVIDLPEKRIIGLIREMAMSVSLLTELRKKGKAGMFDV
jgi:AcrR family transcriptional regulator